MLKHRCSRDRRHDDTSTLRTGVRVAPQSQSSSKDRAPTDAAAVSPHPRAGPGSYRVWRVRVAATCASPAHT